jgi:hypothetical protein
MTISAQSIIKRVIGTLQDTTSIRWPVDELVRYLNDGQREVVTHRPDSTSTTTTHALTTGSRQSLPTNGAKLIEVIRNASASKRAVRLTNREILDAQLPGWHAQSGAVEIVHFMFDPREPRTFYVYPPAAPGAALEIIYASLPTNVPEPAPGAEYTAVTGDLSVPDIHANAVQDYVLYRAYTKDSEYAGNGQRAQAHYGAFANALGMEIKATVGVAPNPVSNPNRGALQTPA